MSLYDVLDDLLYHSSHTAGAHTRCALFPAACIQLFAEAFGRTLNDVSWLIYMAYIWFSFSAVDWPKLLVGRTFHHLNCGVPGSQYIEGYRIL